MKSSGLIAVNYGNWTTESVQVRWWGEVGGLLHYCLMARTHLGALQTFFSEIYTFVNNFIDFKHTI